MVKDEELAKLRILNDIYRNENEYIKLEYRKLYDQFILEKTMNQNNKLIPRAKRIIKKMLKKIKEW